jgi:enoyl-CoA hydratase/carnithine racemase
MSYQGLVYEVEEGIATVRLNDPERLNALTFQTYGELERLFREVADDDAVQVVVLTGTGRGFCSSESVHEIIGKLPEMTDFLEGYRAFVEKRAPVFNRKHS